MEGAMPKVAKPEKIQAEPAAAVPRELEALALLALWELSLVAEKLYSLLAAAERKSVAKGALAALRGEVEAFIESTLPDAIGKFLKAGAEPRPMQSFLTKEESDAGHGPVCETESSKRLH
jgi:hypothetical protein